VEVRIWNEDNEIWNKLQQLYRPVSAQNKWLWNELLLPHPNASKQLQDQSGWC